MTHANLAETPIWAAVLNAAACQATRSDGVSSVIHWRASPECFRYTATDDVTVEPFGIALARGAILEVRWLADTGYQVAVRQPETNPRQAKATMRLSSPELIDTLRASISTPDQRSKRAQVNLPPKTGKRLKAGTCPCGGTSRTCVGNARGPLFIETLGARIAIPLQQSERVQINVSTTTRYQQRDCRCAHRGTCRTCVENARWERIFQQKFADPTYYSHPSTRSGSSLAGR